MKRLLLVGLAGCAKIFALDAPGVASDAANDVASGDAAGADASTVCLDRWHAGTERFGAPAPVAGIGAGTYDRDPFLSQDELVIYWSSERISGATTPDIWRATRQTTAESFAAPQEVVELSSSTEDGKATFTADQLTLVLSSDRGNASGSEDLWYSTRGSLSAAWSTPTEMRLLAVDDSGRQLDPVLSPDGKALYYSALGMPSMQQQILLATRSDATASFSAGTLALAETGGAADADPAIASDGSLLLFGSTRAGGLGATDIWYVQRQGTGWGPPAAVPDINSATTDGDPWLSADGCRLYFSSDRTGPYELYTSSMLP